MNKKVKSRKRNAATRKRKSRKPANRRHQEATAAAPIYSFKIAAMKLSKRGAQLVAAWASAKGLEAYGLSVDPEPLTFVFYAGFEAGRNYLKTSYPKSFGWL